MLGITCLFIAITMIALHYLPWPLLIDHRVLPSPADKVVGVAVIWIGFVGHYRLVAGDPVIVLSVIIVSAGLATMACYVLDLWLDAKCISSDLADSLHLLHELKDAASD